MILPFWPYSQIEDLPPTFPSHWSWESYYMLSFHFICFFLSAPHTPFLMSFFGKTLIPLSHHLHYYYLHIPSYSRTSTLGYRQRLLCITLCIFVRLQTLYWWLASSFFNCHNARNLIFCFTAIISEATI